MKLETDQQLLDQAKVLLKEAGTIAIIWTANDVRDIIKRTLDNGGYLYDNEGVEAVLREIQLSHLSCDDTDEAIWTAVQDAIDTLVHNKLGG